MHSSIWKLSAVMAAAGLLLLSSLPARADVSFNETQALDFGEWAVLGNHGAYSISLAANGSYSSSSSRLIMIRAPQVGIYRVSGLPGDTIINGVNVTVNDPMSKAGSESFTLDNFDVSVPNANSAGETTITLGARANTTGSGISYDDGVYTGELNLELDY